MATSLKILSSDANANAVTTNVNYVNENCADSDLKLFATNLFSLSDNTLNEVYKVTTTDITNTEPDNLPLYSHTNLSSSTTPYELIAIALSWETLDSVTENSGNITFSGTKRNPMSQYAAPVTSEVTAEGTFLKFDVAFGENYETVDVTFEDLYSVMSDTTCTFADFATLMNALNAELNLPFEVTYRGDKSGFLVTPTDDTIDSFSFEVTSGAWKGYIEDALGEIYFEWTKS